MQVLQGRRELGRQQRGERRRRWRLGECGRRDRRLTTGDNRRRAGNRNRRCGVDHATDVGAHAVPLGDARCGAARVRRESAPRGSGGTTALGSTNALDASVRTVGQLRCYARVESLVAQLRALDRRRLALESLESLESRESRASPRAATTAWCCSTMRRTAARSAALTGGARTRLGSPRAP
jgi:hypothetical protein